MKLLVVDGNSILNRAYYGIKPLTTKDGQYTHAIYGFMTMLERIKADTSPDAVAIAFDLKAPTFRHKMYEEYKGNRKGMPEELAQQLNPLKELLKYLGYTIVTCEGYEADDILGTLSKVCADNKNECVLATGDRDNLQLINDYVSVRLAKNMNATTMYTADTVLEEYGVTPKELIEIKAIQGDSSDNIPGVAGIGKKGAGDLIQKYHSVEYIYDHIDELDIKEGMRQKLKDGKSSCLLSRTLGEISFKAPIDTDINSYIVKDADREAASRLMTKLELFSLIKKLGLEESVIKELKTDIDENFEIIKADKNDIESLLKNKKEIVLSCEINDNVFSSFVVIDSDKLFISSDEKLFLEILKSDTEKIVYDSKSIYAYSFVKNTEVSNISFDISLAAYLLSPSSSSYDIPRLCAEYDIKLFKSKEDEDEKYAFFYSMEALSKKLKTLIKENKQEELLYDIEMPLAKVLAKMENIGFKIDVDGIKEYGERINSRLKEIESEIYTEVGYEFNINSPKQLGVALFEKLNLPARKKTKTGYSTSADVLEELADYHPVVKSVLEYRTLAKLKSTYCDSLVEKVKEDGRLHSSFNQKETRTGRISSTEPNLQNIPVRTKLGKELRKYFVAEDNCVLIDADYSQIELRVLAHIADDKVMKETFENNEDIHTITASEVFDMPVDMVTPLMRSRAKAVNFGIVYGIGAFSLGKDIGTNTKEAQQYINAYLEHFSGIDKYMKDTIEKARENGYVETLFGRRRYLPELSASNHMTRAFGERVARNAPIQGTAADIIKIAMIKVDKRLKEENLEARLILQVHDELIVEAPSYEALNVAMILQEEMENAVKLSVPLVAEASQGESWYDAKA